MHARTRLAAGVAGSASAALVAAVAPGQVPPPSRPAAVAAAVVVLGSRSFAPGGDGFGAAHPVRIFNGGDPSGLVTHIRWTGWGRTAATGRGLNALFKPNGGYYPQLGAIVLRASSLGRCTSAGPLAYRRLAIRVPSRPGGKLGGWLLWGGAPSICARP